MLILTLILACAPIDTFARPCPVPTIGPGRPRSVIVEPPQDVEVTAWQCDTSGLVCIQADAWTEGGRWWAACDLDVVEAYPVLLTEWPVIQ